MTDDVTGRPSTPSLFADALSQMTTLFETEIRLVRSEIGEKITKAVIALAVMVVSALLLIVALILLLAGVVQLLIAFGWRPWAANFLVGGVIAVVGVVAVLIAKRGLSAEALAPNRSVTQLGKDVRVVKEQVS